MNRDCFDELIEELRGKGFRITKLRKAIIEELDLARKPLSAVEIADLLKDRRLEPHKTSIYRELGFMLEQGIINKLTFGEKQDRFEIAAMDHHHHAVCQNCGQVEDIECTKDIRKIEDALSAKDFKVDYHLIEFFGLCKNCRKG
ncbi:MAG TPA: transcriptional repressor [Anaerolineae bacterium]|nr:transcriptional repressor [Anaerolineae bacterium]